MSLRPLLLVAFAMLAVRAHAAVLDPKTKSTSGSRQFIVYCPDADLRGRVTGLVEEWKMDVLELLGDRVDRWKIPIVVTLTPAPTSAQAPVKLQMYSTPEGLKIEIAVAIGSDPTAVNLRKHIVRAVMLEIAYRDRPQVAGGERYIEAPWWLIDGSIELLRQRDLGVDSSLFQRLVDRNKLPSLVELLNLRGGNLGATAEAIDAACAMGLVQVLIEQPNGRANLGRLLRRWPEMSDDPLGALAKDFPGLPVTGAAAQKWWTLNLARFAAADRYKGLTADATSRQLDALLRIELPIDKAGTKKVFAISEYEQLLKVPGSRAALAGVQRSLVALSTQANALFRPVVADYEQICASLARGKTKRIRERLAEVERYRLLVLNRMSDIVDYLNWYEATQLRDSERAFDSYLKAVNDQSQEEQKSSDAVSRYLDQLEKEY